MHIAASYFFAAASALAPFGLRDPHTAMHFCTNQQRGVCSHFSTAQLAGFKVHKKHTDVAPKLPKHHVFHLNMGKRGMPASKDEMNLYSNKTQEEGRVRSKAT